MRSFIGPLAVFLLLILASHPAQAGDNWRSYLPFGKRIEADPQKAYRLETTHGPWMVLAASFAGPGADRQAHDLVIELRRTMRVEAYAYHQRFDLTEKVRGLGVTKEGDPLMMKLKHGGRFVEFAVLVGNFQSVEDPSLQRLLDDIKHAQPATLDLKKQNGSTQRFAGLRYVQRRISGNPEKRSRGPMANAFVTRNPLLPASYFTASGVDSFVAEMNKDVPYSLLKNQGKYTVRVARFRGKSTMNPSEADAVLSNRGPSRLEVAFEQAHRMAESLRKKGVEAYVFHDRYESIVAVGSFAEVGRPRNDGTTEINPAIYRTMQSFKPVPKRLANGMQTLVPKQEAGLPFDFSPWPIEVPRVSVAADYAQRRR